MSGNSRIGKLCIGDELAQIICTLPLPKLTKFDRHTKVNYEHDFVDASKNERIG